MGDKIGSRIKELRTSLGLTQEELGDLIGVKKAAINKYESGLVKNIKRDMQARLAEALHTDPASLFYPDAISPEYVLSSSEEILISKFRELNDEGQAELIKQANLLIAGGYIKSDKNGMVDKNA